MIAALPNRHRHAPRRHSALLAVALLACSGLLATPGGGAPPTRPTADDIVEALRLTLPAGWSVTPLTATAVVPTGWQSADAAAIPLQLHDGRQTRTITAVPLDWVGIQNKGATVDLVRRGSIVKVIVSGSDAAGQLDWLSRFAPADASLASPDGTTDAYAGQYARVDSEIRTLLRKSGASRDQAVASFIALGVPAEDMIREAALDTRSPSRPVAIRALRHFPGKATREALAKIIADRSRDAAADRSRLAALDTCEALLIDSHGPAVTTALQTVKDEAVAARLASEVTRLRFAPAAPELRRWLKQAQSIETRTACARALATLRDQTAAADIRAALEAPPPRRAAVTPPADAAARRQLALELHRLAGAWGPEVRGARLSVVMESPDRILVHVENRGAGPLHFIPFRTPDGRVWPVGLEVTFDGEAISPASPGAADIGRASDMAREVPVGNTASFELQLARPIPADGEHIVTATWFDLTANVLTVRSGTIVAAKP